MRYKDKTLYVIHSKLPIDDLDWVIYTPKLMYYHNNKEYSITNTSPDWTKKGLKGKPKGIYELRPKIPISIARQVFSILTHINESNRNIEMTSLKDSATSGNVFVHCFLISLTNNLDHFDDIFTVKGQEQRVVIKKLKNGWKIWGSPVGEPDSNSGKNVTVDSNTYQRYVKMGVDALKNKAIEENYMKLKNILKDIKSK